MTRAFVHVARFTAVLAVAGLLALVLVPAPAGSGGGPYLSALADLTAGQVEASPSCGNRVCDSSLTLCVHTKGYNCARGDFCRERACT
jgi:hypothetical protein